MLIKKRREHGDGESRKVSGNRDERIMLKFHKRLLIGKDLKYNKVFEKNACKILYTLFIVAFLKYII
ncbi:MAG TPA: hypothetical protein DEB74_00640 [Lachnospiraceae bacterium]|nr:hypothetical protein [Lachnospiraceae bacterium]